MVITHQIKLLTVLSRLLLGLLVATTALADDQASDKGWHLSVALGLGQRTNPVMDNGDIPLVILPHLSYQGERFFIDNLDLGMNLAQGDDYQLNLLLTPSYDQVFFRRWDPQNFVLEPSSWGGLTKSEQGPLNSSPEDYTYIEKSRLHKRRMAALVGVEWRQMLSDTWDLSGQCLQEVTGYYSGQECRIALTKSLRFNRHDLAFTLGESWQSAKTLDYFYGVQEGETVGGGAYAAGSGRAALVRMDWIYHLNSAWDLRFFASYKELPAAITRSPLVTDDKVVTAFVGGVYHF